MKTVPLKRIVGINLATLPETTEPSLEFRYVDIGAVGRGQLLSEPEATVFAAAPSRARRLVRQGDTIISTVRTYLRAVWPVRDCATDLVVSTGFAVLTPTGIIDPRYLGWLVQSDVVVEEVVARSVGVSYPAINPSDIGTVRVPLPPLALQRAIADYLDRETARIDALIDKKGRMVGLLEERTRALIDDMTHVSQEGRVRHVTSLCTSGPRGWADRVSGEGKPFIRSANLKRDSIELSYDDLAHVIPPNSHEARRSEVEPGDVLVGITGANTGWIGRVDESLAGGFVSQHVAILRPAGIDPDWLAYSLFSPRVQDQLLGGQYGGTKQQLGLDDLLELRIGLPQAEDQRIRVTRMDTARKTLEALSERLARQVEALQEHRQALITAAVTGELEVPGVAA